MFQVFADSAANIPANIVEKYGIHIMPFINIVDGREVAGFEPGLTPEEERVKGHEYYEALRNGAEVKTSLVNTAKFIEYFTPALEAGDDIMYFSLSKNISGTYNAARLAAEELEEDFPDRRIYLVDSLNASLAQGILALYAVEMQKKGMDPEKIANTLQTLAYGMNGVFTVDDLKHLIKTGRVAKGAAIVGNALQIKPILRGNKDGFIVIQKICRGRKKALNQLIDYVCDNIIDAERQIIGIAQADCYEESLYVMDSIQKRVNVREFINTSYDFCTGSHVGPSTIALFFVAANRELDGPGNVANPELKAALSLI